MPFLELAIDTACTATVIGVLSAAPSWGFAAHASLRVLRAIVLLLCRLSNLARRVHAVPFNHGGRFTEVRAIEAYLRQDYLRQEHTPSSANSSAASPAAATVASSVTIAIPTVGTSGRTEHEGSTDARPPSGSVASMMDRLRAASQRSFRSQRVEPSKQPPPSVDVEAGLPSTRAASIKGRTAEREALSKAVPSHVATSLSDEPPMSDEPPTPTTRSQKVRAWMKPLTASAAFRRARAATTEAAASPVGFAPTPPTAAGLALVDRLLAGAPSHPEYRGFPTHAGRRVVARDPYN